MKSELTALVTAIRAQPWAIMPEYLEAVEAIALRAMDAEILERVAADGHEAQMAASREAVAAMGARLEGSRMSSTVRGATAVVPIIGTIFPRASMVGASTGGSDLASIMHDMRVAQATPGIERIVALVDSPGGVVSGLGEAAEALRASPTPITAFVTGMAGSAAYWLASQAREIVMDRSAAVGSIGVIATTSRQEETDQQGRRAYEVVSSGAPMKRPDPSTEEGRAAIQSQVDAVERVFIEDVAAGRGVTPARVRADFGRGAMVDAAAAVASGMADRIGTLEGVLAQDSGKRRNYGAGGRARATAEIETRRRAANGS
jgi:ClpP class serine protease